MTTMTTTNAMTMGEMMDCTMTQLGLRSIRAYRISARGVDVPAWIVDVVTETAITGCGSGVTVEAALALAVDAARQSAGHIHYLAQRDGAV
jgi:hypothetical protein